MDVFFALFVWFPGFLAVMVISFQAVMVISFQFPLVVYTSVSCVSRHIASRLIIAWPCVLFLVSRRADCTVFLFPFFSHRVDVS